MDEFMKDPQKCMREWIDVNGHPHRYPNLLIHDPMNITELQTLINEATHRHQRYVQASPQLMGLRYLPSEIQSLVMDSLHGQDTVNLLIAFRWQLPDTYWRAPFPKEAVFEFKNLIRRESSGSIFILVYLDY